MSRRTQRNVGVIGLGIIGRRVAESLRRRGFSVFVWNRTPRPVPNFVGSPAEIAQLADFIQIFVADDGALLEMVEQLRPALKAHHVVMAHCTVAPHSMRAAAEIVQRRGAQFLDAPFTGSKLAAEKGELVYYIGGDDAALKRARPVLEGSSKELIEIGEIGQATTIKIATNMVTAATVQVAAEALALVDSSGLAPEKFLAAMRGNATNSATLTMKLPKMIAGDFDPHFSVKHMLKDMEIASRLARSYGLSLGATEAARSSLLAEVRQNRGDDDYTALVRVFFPEKPGKADEEEELEHPTLGLDEVPETAPAEARNGAIEIESSEMPEGEAAEALMETPEEVAVEAETPVAIVTEDIVVETVEEGAVETPAEARVELMLIEDAVPAAPSPSSLEEPPESLPEVIILGAPSEGEEAASIAPALEVSVEKEEETLPKLSVDSEEELPVVETEKRGFFSRLFGKKDEREDDY